MGRVRPGYALIIERFFPHQAIGCHARHQPGADPGEAGNISPCHGIGTKADLQHSAAFLCHGVIRRHRPDQPCSHRQGFKEPEGGEHHFQHRARAGQRPCCDFPDPVDLRRVNGGDIRPVEDRFQPGSINITSHLPSHHTGDLALTKGDDDHRPRRNRLRGDVIKLAPGKRQGRCQQDANHRYGRAPGLKA